MKIFVAGDWHSSLHEEAFARALEALDQEVFRFGWCHYFQPGTKSSWFPHLWRRAQNKFIAGPMFRKINQEFIRSVKAWCPDVVFVYRGTHITPESLKAIKAAVPKATLIGYNNDDPFAPEHPFWLWRHFLAGIPEYDLVFAYRHRNLKEFLDQGARRVRLLRSWFVPECHLPVSLTPEEEARYSCDVVFIGHFEPDGRLKILEEIARKGFDLKIFGPGYEWNSMLRKSSILRDHQPVDLVWNEEYKKALCGAKIALCFLSKLNRDTYTRRCFEIPATRTMMLAEYSDDLASLFKEGVDAEFFRSSEDLLYKIKKYIGDDNLREFLAKKGFWRVYEDGHDVLSRAKEFLQVAADLRREGMEW